LLIIDILNKLKQGGIMKRFGYLMVILALVFVGGLPLNASADWLSDFKTQVNTGNIEGAVTDAVHAGVAPCDILKNGMDLNVNPYAMMKVLFTLDQQAPKEVVVCADGFGILPEVVAQAMFDAGIDPTTVGLAYTPPRGPRAATVNPPGPRRPHHNEPEVSPTQP
jgi:hypothetical protein